MAASLPRSPSLLVLHFADIKCCKFRPPPLFLSLSFPRFRFSLLVERGREKKDEREGKNFGRKTLAVLNPRFATDKFAWKGENVADRVLEMGKVNAFWSKVSEFGSNYSRRIFWSGWFGLRPLKGRKILHPLSKPTRQWFRSRGIPRGAMLFQFPLFLSPLARRLEPEGGGKEGKRKERKKGRKEESFVVGSLLATSYSLPGSTYHNSSEEQSDIRKVTHRHTSYCSRASEVVAFSSRNQGHLLYFPLFFFAFLFFLFLSLFFLLFFAT